MTSLPTLTIADLKRQAYLYAQLLNTRDVPPLYGVNDGKTIGTYLEQGFREFLKANFAFKQGSSASGIDFPDLMVDIKTTSIQQPQSSCPFSKASQKVYGLGYSLLVFIYHKTDTPATQTARLSTPHLIFVNADRTGDYQTTSGLLSILQRDGNIDDVIAFLEERNLPLDEIGRIELANEIMKQSPRIGYLTISNALQWRLQYRRAIDIASQGQSEGVENLLE